MSKEFEGKVALVTGAASGIGAACALQLAASGAAVVVADLDEEGAKKVVAEIEAKGGKAAPFRIDVSVPEEVAAMVAFAKKTFGALHLAVNNAGIGGPSAPVAEYPLDGWRKVIDVNLTGTWLVTREVAASSMIPRRYGRIVNIASVAALKGSTSSEFRAVGYHASKAGIVGMTRALAAEWGRHGITVNAICPGFIPSKMSQPVLDRIGPMVRAMTPLRQIGTEDDMKGIVVLLSSGAARHITGQVIAVDGGVTAV